VAAGGTVLATGDRSATAAVAAPMATLASSGADPIFSLIEDYRAAAKAHAAASSEFSRWEGMLIERGWGVGPFISVLDVSGTYAPHPVSFTNINRSIFTFRPSASPR
jgi:hypothetical protein